jgi:hypothetical protein
MSDTEVLQGGCISEGCRRRRASLEDLIGRSAWERLPKAVRDRFAHSESTVDYLGEFEVVRASRLGKVVAWACQLIGSPVVPRTGRNVPAVVHVSPSGQGVEWRREYRWPDHPPYVVRSTKVIGDDAILVEELPARLRMSLTVFEKGGVLHFVSKAYYFEFAFPWTQGRMRIGLPPALSPGITHVQHIDGVDGWFRFTMTVTHPLFGELFYQTGQFQSFAN